MCYHSETEWTRERWQWRGTPHSPKLKHYWSLTIRLVRVISRTLVCSRVTTLRRSCRYILPPQCTGQPNFVCCIEPIIQTREKYTKIKRIISRSGQTKNNKIKKTKIGRKTRQWILQTVNCRDCIWNDPDMAKKEKSHQGIWISFDNSTKNVKTRKLIIRNKITSVVYVETEMETWRDIISLRYQWKTTTERMDENLVRRIPQEDEEITRNLTTKQKSHQRDEYLGCPSRKILKTIIKVDQRRTSTNGPENKKTHDDG